MIWFSTDNLPYEKVGKNEPVCIADEVPFEIPETWEWVHLSDIAISGLGKTLNKSIDNGKDTPYLCSINVYWTGIDLTTVKTAKFTQTDRDKYLLQKGDLLICEGGDVGRSAVWNYDREMYYQNALHRVRFLGKINPYFFLYLLECYKGLKIIEEYSKGVTIKHFVQSSLNAMFLPLPPLNEQQRIVDKINEIMPVVAKYDTTYSKVTELNETFPEALKRSILQWAVQGNLVPQDPADEPAEALLERIRVEKQRLIKEGKIKKDKHESVIFRRDNSHYEKLDGIEGCIDDALPFEIPQNWEWCRLGSIATVLGGKRIPAGRKLTNQNTGHIYIRVSDMKDGGISTNNLLFVPDDIYPLISKYIIKKEDIFITVAGTIGRVGKIPSELDGANLTENADRLVFSITNQDWLIMVLQSPLIQEQIIEATTKVGQPKLAIARIERLLIPLPPLNEQHRIIKKIEELLPLIKGL